MKKVLIIFFFFLTCLFSAKTYYVAPPGGRDSNTGKINAPWATIQYGINHTKAGDTLYIRGGVYYPTDNLTYDISIRGHSTTSSKPVCIFNYPGEIPIIGNTNINPHARRLALREALYMPFKGLLFTNLIKGDSTDDPYGIQVTQSGHIIFENITVRDIGCRGFNTNGCYDTISYFHGYRALSNSRDALSNIAAKEIIIRNVAVSPTNEAETYA